MAEDNPFGNVPQTMEDMTQSLSRFSVGLSAASKEAKFLQTQLNKFNEQRDMLGKMAKETEELAKANKKASDSFKKTKEEVDKNTSSFSKLMKTVQGTQKVYGRWVEFMGGATITMSGAKKELLSYNQSMFDLSRKMQIAGGSIKDIDSAFTKVKSSTALSKNEFLDFANNATKVWKGVLPTTKGLADLASVMQKRVGPGTRELQEALSDLGSLMTKMPALANTMANAMMGLENGEKGAAEKLKMSATALRAQVEAGNISLDEYEKYLKLTKEGTKSQSNQISTNEQLKKTGASAQDAMLELGKSIEPALKSISESLEGLMNIFQKMPLAVAGGSIAIKGLGTAMNMAAGEGKGLFEWIAKSKGGVDKLGTRGSSGRLASKVGGRALGLVGAGLTGYMVGSGEYKERLESGQSKKDAKKAGWIKGGFAGGGALGGAAAGAAIGSIIPGVGTLIGGAVGGIAGGFAGGWAGEKASDAIVPEQQAQAVEEAVEETADKAKDALRSFLLWKQEYEQIKKLAEENVAIQKQYIDMVSSYGDATGDKGAKMIENMQKKMEESIEASRKSLEAFASGTGTFDFSGFNIAGIDDIQARIQEAMSGGNLAEALSNGLRDEATNVMQNEIDKLTQKRNDLDSKKNKATSDDGKALIDKEMVAIQTQITTLMTKQNTFREQAVNFEKAKYALIKATFDTNDQQYNDAKSMNQAYQERLDLEKDLMEAAQFGMGASVEMMQKQVDMAYELIELEKQRGVQIEAHTSKLLDQTNLNDQQKAQVKGLIRDGKSQMQVQSVLNSMNIKDKDTRQIIFESAKRMNEVTSNQLKQQKKIYDITKDVREGYLDALMEMSSGFGEFEKIIGTQDAGSTQLMDAVNKYNSKGDENLLNTMALGGYQSSSDTNRGIGTELTGGYSATPGKQTLHFIGGREQNERNKRYTGYDDTMSDYYNGQKNRSSVGDANALNDKFEGAMVEGALTPENMEKANKDGTKEGVLEAFAVMGRNNPVNIGVRTGSFTEGGVSRGNPRSVTSGPDFGAGVLSGASSSTRADAPALQSSGGGGASPQGTYGVPPDVYGLNPQSFGVADETGVTYRNQHVPLKLSGFKGGVSGGSARVGGDTKTSTLSMEEIKASFSIIKSASVAQLQEMQKENNESILKAGKTVLTENIGYHGKNALDTGRELVNAQSAYDNAGINESSDNNEKNRAIAKRLKRAKEEDAKASKIFKAEQEKRRSGAGTGAGRNFIDLETQEVESAKKAQALASLRQQSQQDLNKYKKNLASLDKNKSGTIGDRDSLESLIKTTEDQLESKNKAYQEERGRLSEIREKKKMALNDRKSQLGSKEGLTGQIASEIANRKTLSSSPEENVATKLSPEQIAQRREMAIAQHMRQSIGESEGLSPEDIRKKLNAQLVAGGANESMDKNQIAEMKKRMDQASNLKYKRSNLSDSAHADLAAQQMGENGEIGGGGVNSIEAEKGYGIKKEDEENFMRAEGSFSSVYGSESAEGGNLFSNGGGGSGSVNVYVSLSPELIARIESQGSVIAELNNAV